MSKLKVLCSSKSRGLFCFKLLNLMTLPFAGRVWHWDVFWLNPSVLVDNVGEPVLPIQPVGWGDKIPPHPKLMSLS
jgi:hypothetical protein